MLIPMNIASYLIGKIDSFIVGRAGGAATLGVYGFAADLSTMLTSDLMKYINRALYPSYTAIGHDRSRLAEAYLVSLSATLIISVAFGAGLYAVRRISSRSCWDRSG
jgi:O-antigen/teichoic acid export membrane protein